MDEAAILLVKIAGAALLFIVIEIAGEAVMELIAAPARIGLEWLHNRWWAQRLYRRRSAAWLFFVWIPAMAITWAALQTISNRSDWVGTLALILFFIVPLAAVAMTGWWLHSPFRRRHGEA